MFPHCGPLVLASSPVVAGRCAHRELAQFCSAHWELTLLYLSPEGCQFTGVVIGRAAGHVRSSSDLNRATRFRSGIQDFSVTHAQGASCLF